jgi:O-antigen/teichoic acid export membrane protein
MADILALAPRLTASFRRLASEQRLRAEIGWVVGNKLVEFGFAFVLLKVLTNLLGRDGFGEYNLADTALLLIASVILTPVHEPYLRDYHGALKRGEGRAWGVAVLRWYLVCTVGFAAIAALLTEQCAHWFDIGRWTTLAAGAVFLFERWRFIGQEILNIRRERRAWAVQNLTYCGVQVGAIWAVLSFWSATPGAALLAYAGAAAIFAFVEGVPLVRSVMRLPGGPRPRITSLVWSFGIPYALLLVFQWAQGFTDRYLLKALIDIQTVGLYVACYQVCGIPYTLLLRVTHSLLTPIAYARARDFGDARGLWSADRVLVGGIVIQLVIGVGMVVFFAVFGQQVLILFTNRDFLMPTSTIVALTAGRFVQQITQSLQPIFAVHNRMGSMFWFRVLGATFTVAICWYGISWYGAFGAALGSLLAFSLYLVFLVFAPSGCWWLVMSAKRGAARPGLVPNDTGALSH